MAPLRPTATTPEKPGVAATSESIRRNSAESASGAGWADTGNAASIDAPNTSAAAKAREAGVAGMTL